MRRGLIAALAILCCTYPARAQTVATGLSRDTIRVGDPFRVLVRIDVPPGTEVLLPDSLGELQELENSGQMRSRRDSSAAGVSVVAAYSLTAWRPDSLPLPRLSVRLRDTNGERTLSLALPVVPVVSVLPADTTGIKARPPHDVLGGNRVWWPWIVAALVLLALLAALYWWYRKRRRGAPAQPAVPLVLPRDAALQELERIRALQLPARGELREHYTLLSEALRRYLATVDASWSTDLTTTELAARLKPDLATRPAVAILRTADLAKFARSNPAQAEAERDLDRAREFVAAYPPPVIAEPEKGEAA